MVLLILISEGAFSEERASAAGAIESQADLEAALVRGEPVLFQSNVTIAFTNAITIRTNVTIDGSGRNVILDAQNRTRHFVVTHGATLHLKGLSLINGAFYGGTATHGLGEPGFGGAVYSDGAALELVSCTFSNNMTMAGEGRPPLDVVAPKGSANGGPGGGGAIYAGNGELVVSNCLFTANRTTGGRVAWWAELNSRNEGGSGSGGAVYATNSALALTGVTFSDNFAFGGESASGSVRGTPGGGAYGGALAQAGATAMVTRCLFVANHARGGGGAIASGGAFFHDGGATCVQESSFTNNLALGGGAQVGFPELAYGGFGLGGAVLNQSGMLEIRNSALVFNHAKGGEAGFSMFSPSITGNGEGGGIFNRGELRVINSTIGENEASAGTANGPLSGSGGAAGGGICGNATLVNVTMARNGVAPVANMWGRGGGSIAGDGILTNTILFCLPGQPNVAGTILDGGHNLCSDASAGFSLPSSFNSRDPLLGPVADNGGFTPTVALSPKSPALNAADPAASPQTDQRGIRRPTGAGSDIGAYELAPMLTFNHPPDTILRVTCLYQPFKTTRLDISTDLIQWVGSASAVSDSEGISEFQDPDGFLLPRRFYRVEVMEP
ncbi:MAG: choice-of-anchor Q domain-containing protein [Verrucomicrobiia bacterium]